MNLGLAYGIKPLEEIIRDAKKAEEIGMDTIWIADDSMNAFVFATFIAQNTENIKVGPGATNVYIHRAESIATSMLTLNEIARGRTVVMLGMGPLLGKSEKPITDLCNAVRIMKKFFKGDLNNIRRFTRRFKFRPDLPVYIAGNGPQMLAMSLKEADGFELAHMPVEYVKYMRPRIRKQDFEFGNDILMFVDHDEDKARSAARKVGRAITFPINIQRHREVHQVLDISEKDLEPFKSGRNMDIDPEKQNEILDNFALIGTPEQIIKRIKKYRDAGIDRLDITPVGEYFGDSKVKLEKKLAFQVLKDAKKELK